MKHSDRQRFLTIHSGEIPEMIASVEPLNSGFILTDPSDPRYQYILKLKGRFGVLLHDASVSLRQQGEENTLDAVQMLVSTRLSWLAIVERAHGVIR